MDNIITIRDEELKVVGACGMKVTQYNQLSPQNRHMINGQCFAYIKNSIRDGWHVVNFPKKNISK